MKKPYSDYVRYIVYQYLKTELSECTDETAKANWLAVDEALKGFTQPEVSILKFIYRQEKCSMHEAIDRAIFGSDMRRNHVWSIINRLEVEIASKRGL